MTDADVRRAAQELGYIEHHEREIKELERRIKGHQDQAALHRANVDGLKAGRMLVNKYGQIVEVK